MQFEGWGKEEYVVDVLQNEGIQRYQQSVERKKEREEKKILYEKRKSQGKDGGWIFAVCFF